MAKQKKIDPLNLRFIQVMEALGHTGYSLSKKLGTSEAVISNVRLGKNPPNIQLVRSLLKEYEDVDADWLLCGNGRMYRSATTGERKMSIDLSGSDAVDKLDQLIELFNRSIEVQLRKNLLSDEAILALESDVALLKKDVTKAKKVLDKAR